MMQAYAEGYELLEKADLVDNVPAVFDSWRQGTVVRSWLLDLLSRGTQGGPGPQPGPGLRRGLRRGALDGRGSDRQRGPGPGHRGYPCSRDSCPTGGVAGHAGHRRDAQPVRWPCRPAKRDRPCTSPDVELHDFRSYPHAEVALTRGADRFHRRQRAGQDEPGRGDRLRRRPRIAPSCRRHATHPGRHAAGRHPARRAAAERSARLEVEISSGRSNRGRINGSAVPRMRDMIGVVRTVMFSPEDLALVKGDPSDRRRFVDALLTLRTPRLGGVRADYDRVLKQRNTLLKSARGRSDKVDLSTLDIWDDKLATLGGELIAQRLATLTELAPPDGVVSTGGRRCRSRPAAGDRDLQGVDRPARPATPKRSAIDCWPPWKNAGVTNSTAA